MLVFLHQSLFRLLADEVVTLQIFVVGNGFLRLFCWAEAVAFVWILIGKAIGTNDLIETVVGAIGRHIVLEIDGLTLESLDERLSHFAVGNLGVLYAHLLFHETRQGGGRYIHGREELHAVTTMDIQYPTGWAKAVRCVDITTIFFICLETPVTFVVFPERL